MTSTNDTVPKNEHYLIYVQCDLACWVLNSHVLFNRFLYFTFFDFEGIISYNIFYRQIFLCNHYSFPTIMLVTPKIGPDWFSQFDILF